MNYDSYEDKEICAACGGKCCKTLGGAAFPEDILRLFGEPLEAAVSKALASGDWVIDWWEGDPREGINEIDRGYYVRPRSEGDDGLFCPSWGGRCLLLTPNGCRLPLHLRPITCRALEPVADGKCILHAGGKREAALAWLGYHSILLKFEGA